MLLDVSDESSSLREVHNLPIVQQMTQAVFGWCNTCHLKYNILPADSDEIFSFGNSAKN